MPTSAPLATFARLPLSALTESKANPRQTFDQVALDELTAQIRDQGILEPLLVRPLAKGGYELVAGARRLRAAKAAGLTEVPCMVQERHPTSALETALVENLGRVDLSALEEGATYKRLIDEHKHTVETLMKITGKARTTLFSRMKLAGLQGEARKLVLAGKLSASIGELVARLPTAATQEAALERLKLAVKYSDLEGDTEDDLSGLPFRLAKETLEDEFNLALKTAPFDTADSLLALAGTCAACPKRTGAAKDLFPGVKDDTCLDGACWDRKKKAALDAKAAALKADGKKLIKDGAALFSQQGDRLLTYAAAEKYSTPAEKPAGATETWQQLLGSDLPLAVAVDAKGKEHHLVDTKAALAQLAVTDPKTAAKLEEAGRSPSEVYAEQAKAEQAKRAVDERVFELLKARALSLFDVAGAVDLWVQVQAADDYAWRETLSAAGLKSAKLATLKPAEKARLLVGEATRDQYGKRADVISAVVAKKAKLDLKKLRKQSAAAVAGTCWVCGCVEAKACKGGCSWVDDEKTLCSRCVGG